MWRRPGAYTIASLFSCENRSSCVRIACGLIERAVRQWSAAAAYAEPAAPTPKKRAGDQALQGTIASPPHHEELSSWRL
jgi:hypothetical protein